MYIHTNIRFLRKSKGWTQEKLAMELDVKRSVIGAWEEERARPTYEVLFKLAEIFHVSLENLLQADLRTMEKVSLFSPAEMDEMVSGKHLRVLSITVDEQDNENIEFVPVKASAGYLNGYADPQYLKELNRFRLPFLPVGTYRAFEIKGDSMLPVLPGSIIIGEYVDNWRMIQDGATYIVISKNEGIVYKRLFPQTDKGEMLLRSDNPSYPPYTVPLDEVLEVWKAVLNISSLNKNSDYSFQQIISMMQELKQDVEKLKVN